MDGALVYVEWPLLGRLEVAQIATEDIVNKTKVRENSVAVVLLFVALPTCLVFNSGMKIDELFISVIVGAVIALMAF